MILHIWNISIWCDEYFQDNKTVSQDLDNELIKPWWNESHIYRKTSNIRPTLVGNNIVNHSDVVGASPVGAAATTSSFLT